MLRNIVTCVLLIFLGACSTLPKNFIRMDSGTPVQFNEVLAGIEDERVIFVGEIHTNPSSHKVQFEIIRHLIESGRDVSIAIEVFPSENQEYLNRWVDGAIGKGEFIRTFNSVVNLPFRAYEDIFYYAREKNIPVIGIDAVRESIAIVSKKGPDTVPREFSDKVKFTECAESPEYMKLLGFDGKRDFHQSGMPYLCDGQRLRDAVMAYNISKIIQDGTSTVVVMLGLVHASRIAVPDMLRKHTDVDYTILMPEQIRYITNKNPASDVADYIWY